MIIHESNRNSRERENRKLRNEPFFEKNKKQYFLKISESELKILTKKEEVEKEYAVEDVKRSTLKELVNSSRLDPFLQKIKTELEEANKAYASVARMAKNQSDVEN